MGQIVDRVTSKIARRMSQQTADEFALYSRVDRPIQEMTFLRRGLLMAELSTISYMEPKEIRRCVDRLGFGHFEFFERDGSQAYWFSNDHDSIIACRGTEPHEWNDIKADAYAVTALAETVGRVHRGFKQEVDDLWPRIEKVLAENRKIQWFTGHSLGGAMATICGGRCKLSKIPTMPEEVHTFGSPRVGNKRYVNHTQLSLFRWVNNNDIVTRVPPAWMGYRHTGEEKYLDRNGDLSAGTTGWKRTSDRLRGFLRGLARFKIDQFSDHLMPYYIEYICKNIERQEAVKLEPDIDVGAN